MSTPSTIENLNISTDSQPQIENTVPSEQHGLALSVINLNNGKIPCIRSAQFNPMLFKGQLYMCTRAMRAERSSPQFCLWETGWEVHFIEVWESMGSPEELYGPGSG